MLYVLHPEQRGFGLKFNREVLVRNYAGLCKVNGKYSGEVKKLTKEIA